MKPQLPSKADATKVTTAEPTKKLDASVPAHKPKLVIDQITPEHLPQFSGTTRGYNDGGQGGVKFPGGAVTRQWWKGGWDGPKEAPDFSIVRDNAKSYPHGSIVSIDIEGQHVHDLRSTDRVSAKAALKLKCDVVRAMKESRPDLRVGLYATTPTDYWNAVYTSLWMDAQAKPESKRTDYDLWLIAMGKTWQAGILKWGEACAFCKPLIDVCDFVEIDLYPRYNANDGQNDPQDIKSDAAFVQYNVHMARSVSGKKPIYGSISNQIFEPDVDPLLRPARMRALCEAISISDANGAIFWNWTQGKPLDKQQTECIQIAVDVIGGGK